MRSANTEYKNQTLMLETSPKKQEGITGTKKVPAKMMNIPMIQNMYLRYIKVVSLTVHFSTTQQFCRHM
jgi:hypothetical protein